MMCMAERDCERVGRVGRQTSFDIERATHHMSYLHLIRTAEPHYRELDRTRRVFRKLDRLPNRSESRTASLPEFQGTIDVATNEDLFDGHLGWSKLDDQVTHTGMDA